MDANPSAFRARRAAGKLRSVYDGYGEGAGAMRMYTAIIERCPDTGLYVGYVPGFPGAHSQGETLDALNRNLQEVIEMLLKDDEPPLDAQYVGTQTVTVSIPSEQTNRAIAEANRPAKLKRYRSFRELRDQI